MKFNIANQSVEWEQKPNFSTIGAICRAGKTCYKAANIEDKDKMEIFVKGLIKRGHESVIEHSLASFRIICSRGLSHELVRHRLCSFSQESTRYCNYNKKGFIIIKPDYLMYEHPKLESYYDTWFISIRNCFIAYNELLEKGISPEYARGVLPLDLKTELVMSGNLREWRHIIKLRTGKGAHPQMQKLMNEIKKMFLDSDVKCIFEDL